MLDPVDLLLSRPQLLTAPRMVRLSTDALPELDDLGAELQVGQRLLLDDVGLHRYWSGAAWLPVGLPQQIDLLIDAALEIRDLLTTLTEDDE